MSLAQGKIRRQVTLPAKIYADLEAQIVGQETVSDVIEAKLRVVAEGSTEGFADVATALAHQRHAFEQLREEVAELKAGMHAIVEALESLAGPPVEAIDATPPIEKPTSMDLMTYYETQRPPEPPREDDPGKITTPPTRLVRFVRKVMA